MLLAITLLGIIVACILLYLAYAIMRSLVETPSSRFH